jgi:amino-acid N-acetyltransferase
LNGQGDLITMPAMEEVVPLLVAAALPHADIDEQLVGHFLAIRLDGEVVGIAGLEPCGRNGLLRSLVVRDTHRRSGLGRRLVTEAERRAAAIGIETLYVLTNTAAAYFRRFGYSDCPRDAAPPAIRQTREFSSLCPDDAAFLRKRL